MKSKYYRPVLIIFMVFKIFVSIDAQNKTRIHYQMPLADFCSGLDLMHGFQIEGYFIGWSAANNIAYITGLKKPGSEGIFYKLTVQEIVEDSIAYDSGFKGPYRGIEALKSYWDANREQIENILNLSRILPYSGSLEYDISSGRHPLGIEIIKLNDPANPGKINAFQIIARPGKYKNRVKIIHRESDIDYTDIIHAGIIKNPYEPRLAVFFLKAGDNIHPLAVAGCHQIYGFKKM